VRGVRVTVTLPAPIGTLAGHSPRLVSRLHGGLTASLPPLSAGSRRELVKRLASARQLPLTDDVLDWLIELPPGTPRTLTQLLDRIATAAASGRRPDLAAVRRWIQPAAPSDRVSLGRIAAVVADDFGITLGELRSESRQQALRLPRQCAMYLAHAVGGWPMERIGRYFGRRAHTSVSHNCRKLQELLPQAPSLQDQLQRLQARLWEHPREECG
jgi:chromosomal replication initiator protein